MFTESPVPLEFTPVLGILVGVVLTLMLVAFVVILILRLKYQTHKTAKNNGRTNNRRQAQQHVSQNNGKKKEKTKANNNSKATPNEKDAEEYYCMTSSKRVESPNNKNVGKSTATVVVLKDIESSTLNNRQGDTLKGTTHSIINSPLLRDEVTNPDVILNCKYELENMQNHRPHNSIGK